MTTKKCDHLWVEGRCEHCGTSGTEGLLEFLEAKVVRQDADLARLRAILEKQDAAILSHDALKAEVERLTQRLQKVHELEGQIASTADFLNTCLRESNLARDQVGVDNLKPGIDALYFALAKAEAVVRAVEGLLKEPTIAETIRSMRAMDMAFAHQVPRYRADCESVQRAANAVDKALAAVRERA